jgi:V/A-type H+/Na+-transporting ATPase subunit C
VKIGQYDYLNARVRAMGSELLTAEVYDQALAAPGDGALADILLATAYGRELREALTVSRGRDAMESALRRNLHATFAKVLAMAPPQARALLVVQVGIWDAVNVIALVRGKLRGAEPGEIMAAVMPLGELGEPQLEELAASPDLRSLADALTTWNTSFSFDLRRAILEAGVHDLSALEAAVGGVYFDWALRQLPAGNADAAVLRRIVEMQIDLANLKAALDHVSRQMRNEETEELAPLPGGQLAPGQVQAVAQATTLVEAFELIAETYFEPGVENGILAFGRTQKLAAMERFLEAVVMGHGCRLYRGDPLSVAVPVGYLWRKYSEFLNLRMVLRGRSYRMPPDAIRKEMLIA